MERWLKSNEHRKIVIVVLVSFIVVFIEFFGFMHFRNKLYSISLRNSYEQLEKISKYIEKNFRIVLNHYENDLRVIELQLKKEKNILSNNMLKQIEDIDKVSKFTQIGISDLDGNIVDTTGNRYTKVHKDVRRIIENDRVYISNVLDENNKNLIFIAIPLKIDNKIVGSLWGKVLLDKAIESIEFDEDSDRYFQIIDDNGHYILSSKNKNSFYNNAENLWEELPKYKYLKLNVPKIIYNNLKEGKSGEFYFEKNGNGRYVNYRPLKIRNWYIFSVQVKDDLNNYVYSIQSLTLKLLIVLTIGLLVIFGIVYKLIHDMYLKLSNQYNYIEDLNIVFETILHETKDIIFIIDKKAKSMLFFGYPNELGREVHSFEEMKPENMLKTNKIDENNLENYTKFYTNAILKGKTCEPIILYTAIGLHKRWIRIRFIENDDPKKRIIGVLEGYDEQREKELLIMNQLNSIKEIEKKSQVDFLTKLYNRESFLERVKAELEIKKLRPENYVFLIIDIDNFKDINDYLGHKIGDNVLEDIGKILQDSFRKKDLIGRLGGDEFVIFLKDIFDLELFEQRIKNLNKRLCRVYEKNNVKINISGSIGVVIEKNYLSFNELYEKADEALYKVKHSGGNNYQIYENK